MHTHFRTETRLHMNVVVQMASDNDANARAYSVLLCPPDVLEHLAHHVRGHLLLAHNQRNALRDTTTHQTVQI